MSEKIQSKNSYLIGIISDTHGHLPQSASIIFEDADLIVHAGDIGDPQIIDVLQKIAPTRAVRGNMDMGQWARQFPQNETITVGSKTLYVIHDVYHLDIINTTAHGCHVVIFGHTHKPQVEKREGILYVNPGSAVHPRYGYPPSAALLEINDDAVNARLVELDG
jgi:putative phosphoesterase